jgi:hypothetical protein
LAAVWAVMMMTSLLAGGRPGGDKEDFVADERRPGRFGYLKTVFLERRSETRTQSRLSKKTVFVQAKKRRNPLPRSFGLCANVLQQNKVNTATKATKTTATTATTTTRTATTQQQRSNNAATTQQQRSNNAATTTARIYFNTKSRRQRPQGQTKASAEQQQSAKFIADTIPTSPAASCPIGHPQLPEAMLCS